MRPLTHIFDGMLFADADNEAQTTRVPQGPEAGALLAGSRGAVECGALEP